MPETPKQVPELPLTPDHISNKNNTSEFESQVGSITPEQDVDLVTQSRISAGVNLENTSNSELLDLPPSTSLIQSRWEKIRQKKLSRNQEEVLCWGSMAVIGAAYPFTGGVSHQAIEVSKQIIGFEGLFAYVGLSFVAAKKVINNVRKYDSFR